MTEYHLMGQVGILHEDDRVELIEGEPIVMSPIGPGHSGAINLLTRTLVMADGQVEVCRAPGTDDYASLTTVGREGTVEPEMLT